MAPLKVLVIGAGVGGTGVAFWLGKAGHDVTVIERAPQLRANGQQIDLRGQGLTVTRRMGLLDAVRSKRVEEQGVMFVDSKGTNKAFLGINDTGKGAQAFTSEYEIMRGDLIRILYDASLESGNAKYVFGTTVTSFSQDNADAKSEDGGKVRVTLSDGREEEYDLVVGADGQGSRTRRQILGLTQGQPDPTSKFLGVYAGFYSLPHDGTRPNVATAYHAPGGRLTLTRVDNPKTFQVYHMLRADHPLGRDFGIALAKRDVAAQKQIMAEAYQDAGWETKKLVHGMLNDRQADDFYATDVASIVSPVWSKGRIVLLGDAGYSSATFSGFGTSMALVGAYVLAGELTKNTTFDKDRPRKSLADGQAHVLKALRGYEDILRPFATKLQNAIPGWIWSFTIPHAAWGVWLLRFVVTVLTFLRIDKLAQRFGSDDKAEWTVPDYPEVDALVKSS
ncbi:hypothetical protein PpBr36_04078 [Pyricularia pennisetigena]|uniref:hypothetical protein n=1 Tax=Pyricularia pennisetigena TaxID=1578925 RepID=UPI00114E8040|nr:hypothetical protein PpBr36_04078 [Pyricularia pennisetigena]TLS26553.1 hypothetical protein PpBr36_04078 [Pyricularia pennisetigena]